MIGIAEILLEPGPDPFWTVLRQVGVEQAVGAEADGPGREMNSHGAIISQHFHSRFPAAVRCLLIRGAVDRLRAFGGLPCLLRKRQEPIEPLS